jgi:hypothetical protein
MAPQEPHHPQPPPSPAPPERPPGAPERSHARHQRHLPAAIPAEASIWWRHRGSILAIALIASLTVHALLLALAAVLVFGRGSGPGGPSVEPVEFAIMTDVELARLEQEALLDDVPEIPSEESELPDIELSEELLDAEVSALIQDLGDVGSQVGAGDVTGEGLGVGGAGAGGASFFGIEATGNRFAYLVDVSGSMNVAGKLQSLQAELNRSLTGLSETSSFFVALFSGGATPLTGEVKWTDSTPSGKSSARARITGIESGGGTNPVPGFQMIFTLRPRPDAIYFMTDGQFAEDAVVEIERLNHNAEIPIHCITFGASAGEAEATMRHIARRSGGTYTHVPGPGG